MTFGMDNTTILFITSILTLLTTIIGGIFAFIARRASQKNSQAIQEVHLSVNSRLDELLKQTQRTAHAEGMAEGVGKSTDREAAADQREAAMDQREAADDQLVAAGVQKEKAGVGVAVKVVTPTVATHEYPNSPAPQVLAPASLRPKESPDRK